MSSSSSSAEPAVVPILDTAEGEFALLSAIIHARPVGLQKHWAMIAILRIIDAKLGEGRVTSDQVWSKLHTLYDLRMLNEDSLDLEAAQKADDYILATTQAAFSTGAPSTSTNKRPPPPRRSRRTSGTHERPENLVEPTPFDLVHKVSFHEELERRRRAPSSSPGQLGFKDELDYSGDSDLSAPDDEGDQKMDAETTVRMRETDEADAGEDEQLTPIKAEAVDDGEARLRDSASPTKDLTEKGRTKGRRGKRASLGDAEEDVPRASRRGHRRKQARRQAQIGAGQDETLSESASTLSELSEGEAGRKKKVHQDPDSKPTGKSEDALPKSESEEAEQEEQEADERDGTEDENDDEQMADGEEVQNEKNVVGEEGEDDTETASEVDDTPYKSPKTKRKTAATEKQDRRSPTARAPRARGGATASINKTEGKTRASAVADTTSSTRRASASGPRKKTEREPGRQKR